MATDIGNVASTANSYFKFNEGRKHIAALTFGNTGFSYPAALGAKLGRPDCPVINIVGDGAWGMSLHEVSTAVQEKYSGGCLCLSQYRLVCRKEKPD